MVRRGSRPSPPRAEQPQPYRDQMALILVMLLLTAFVFRISSAPAPFGDDQAVLAYLDALGSFNKAHQDDFLRVLAGLDDADRVEELWDAFWAEYPGPQYPQYQSRGEYESERAMAENSFWPLLVFLSLFCALHTQRAVVPAAASGGPRYRRRGRYPKGRRDCARNRRDD